MQTVGTPVTTTTVAGSESAGISATSSAPAAPFDAVMALMTQISVDPSATPSAVPSNGLTPVQPVSADGIPTVFPAFSAGATPPVAAVAMVSPQLVNATAPADEAGLDALLAATALAGRGITARAPAPQVPLVPAVSDIPPEDFIGPVKPSVLTADAAVPSGAAARPQEFDMANAMIDPEFIGPMRPSDWQAASADAVMVDGAISVEVADLDPEYRMDDLHRADERVDENIVADLPAQSPLGADALEMEAIQDAPMVPVAEDVLPDAEALLQREEESSEYEQPLVSSMAPSFAQADAFMPTPSRVMASTAERDMMAVHAATKLAAVKPAEAPTARAAQDEISLIASADGLVQGAVHRDASHHDGAPNDEHAHEMDVPALPDLAAMMPANVNPFLTAAPSQANLTQQPSDAAIDDVTSAPRNVLPPVAPLAPRAEDLTAMPQRDAALLQTMAAMSQPRGKSEIRSTAPAATTNSAFMAIETSSFTPEQRLPEARALAARDEARRLDLPVERVAGEKLASDTLRNTVATSAVDANPLDPKLTAMIHGVTVSGGAADDQIASSSAATLAAINAAPQMPTIATVSRDAPLVSAVVADGRRDTQRDAEIRERQIKNQVTAALRAGQQEVRMQLYPPGLGQILIRIAMDGGKLRLSMKAASTEAADALVQAETGLRDALSRDGFALASFDVHDDDNKGRNSRQQVEPATTMNHATAEGEAFSVDMTA